MFASAHDAHDRCTARLVLSMRTHGWWRGATRFAAAAIALSLCASSSEVRAHGMDADRVELVLHGDTVEAVATPSVAFVRSVDVNGDGLLSLDEVNPQREEIRRVLVDALSITDEGGLAGALDRSDVSLPHGHDGDTSNGRSFLRITVKLRWPAALRAVRVRCAFASVRPVTVYATRAESQVPGVLTLSGVPELARLESADATATLLRSASASAPVTTRSVTTAAAPLAHTSTAPHRAWWLGAVALCGLTLAASRRRSLRLETTTPQQGETR